MNPTTTHKNVVVGVPGCTRAATAGLIAVDGSTRKIPVCEGHANHHAVGFLNIHGTYKRYEDLTDEDIDRYVDCEHIKDPVKERARREEFRFFRTMSRTAKMNMDPCPNPTTDCKHFDEKAGMCGSECTYERPTFLKALETLINSYSMENPSNTPDWILAEYLNDCLTTFTKTSNAREKWYGRDPKPGHIHGVNTNILSEVPDVHFKH